jgi:hypothetical protein
MSDLVSKVVQAQMGRVTALLKKKHKKKHTDILDQKQFFFFKI